MNFKYYEVTNSAKASQNGINNEVPKHLFDNMLRSVHYMQLLRNFVGKPIIVSSWYRCKELNTAIKGSKTSSHMDCDAVDFVIKGVNIKESFDLVTKWLNTYNVVFDQLIKEKSGSKEWIHISFSSRNRKEIKSMVVE